MATWRLKSVTEKGYFFYTSKGFVSSLVTPARFDFMCRKFLLDKVEFPNVSCESSTAPTKRIKITIEKEDEFMRRKYTKEMLDSLIDDIDTIEF